MNIDEFGLAGRRIDDRYEVEEAVAAGGFGTVYRGRHRALKTLVAIKVLRIPAELADSARHAFAQRFLAEAQTLAQLQHPAVVRVTDFGVSPMPSGQIAPWMALEWIDGPTLREYSATRRGEAMTPADALALLRPVIEALAAAHGDGVAHRDIKPANIMLPRGAGALPSRILDFGIAKAMQPDENDGASGQTRTKSALNAFSLKYAAPEQVGGMRTGPWTDVHALALVLTELVTGRDAYPGSDALEITAAAISTRRPTPATFGVDVGALEPVLARAMAFKPADRFRNAAEFLEALDSVVTSTGRAPRMQSFSGQSASPFAPNTEAPAVSRSIGPGSVFGAYTIVRELGAGGMGAVYEATRSGLQKRVAVKVMHPSVAQHAGGAERFVQEARAAASVKHPHIVGVEDLGVIEGVPFMVMEFLEGETLTSLISREGPRTPEGAMELLLPVFSAVAAVHEKGIVHRDIKPDNVYLWSPLAGQVHPKLLDFGIAKVRPDQRAGSVTATGTVLGTPHYLAPEQLSGSRHATEASDQWALAVVLYQCLTASVPFPGDDVLKVLSRVLGEAPPSPRVLNPTLPPELDAAVMRALEKDPARRFASVRDFGRALMPFASRATFDRWAREFGLAQPLRAGPDQALPQGAMTSGSFLAPQAASAAPDTFQRASVEIGVRREVAPSRRGVWIGAVVGALLLGGGVVALTASGRESAPAQADVPTGAVAQVAAHSPPTVSRPAVSPPAVSPPTVVARAEASDGGAAALVTDAAVVRAVEATGRSGRTRARGERDLGRRGRDHGAATPVFAAPEPSQPAGTGTNGINF